MAYIHEGVYGDHSTDGWLEWGVDARFAMQRVGEDALQITSEQAAENPVLSQHRAEAIDNLGYLAAQELRDQGIEIKGFEQSLLDQLRPVERGLTGDIPAFDQAMEQGRQEAARLAAIYEGHNDEELDAVVKSLREEAEALHLEYSGVIEPEDIPYQQQLYGRVADINLELASRRQLRVAYESDATQA